ncbi:MAG: superoxide dismutase family protein [Brevundimonas sp.]|jgi:Cu-Zn family superoxide dismutase|uniref:superoxide dismutase family protein n=1 Tax=Brevundimonas sp. TaxID=1871086 RepID=UPI00184C339E|nr:superoxide dismutase family protein [Brevundimonas sp.]MBA4804132.1 superoxide dismutase family protein [Brevundimonas sp.]
MAVTRLAGLAAVSAAVSLGACATMPASHAEPRASLGDFGEATLVNATGARIGRAVLTQGPTGLLIRVEADGLTPGWHGIHIHATGACEAPFTSAGGHINHAEPKAPHGLLNAEGPDDGDLPNVFADAQGRVRAELFTTRARIAPEGPGQWLWDADGSALVIHANADDHRTQPIGGAGDRVACGVMAAG